jgi:hypothetical protein
MICRDAVMILGVELEMIGQLGDPLAQIAT